MTPVIFSDIDGTLCLSERRVATHHSVRIVDDWNGGRSVTTTNGYRAWSTLAGNHAVIPTTARTADQFMRLAWPGPAAAVALVENGAILMRQGRIDPTWTQWAQNVCSALDWDETRASELVVAHIGAGRKARLASDCFVCHVHPAPPSIEAQESLRMATARYGWNTSVQGRKTYVAPACFGKRQGVSRLVDIAGLEVLAAAGDSRLDAGFMELAPRAACPASSELAPIAAAHVRVIGGPHPVGEVGAVAEWLLTQWQTIHPIR